MWHESGRIGMISLLGLCCWTLALSVEPFWLLEEHCMYLVLSLLALARSNEINFHVAEDLGWFSYNFGDKIVYNLRAVENLGRSTVTYPVVLVRYRDECHDDGIGVSFAQAVLDKYCRKRMDLFWIPWLAKQSQFVASPKANNCGGVDPSVIRSSKEEMFDAVVEGKQRKTLGF